MSLHRWLARRVSGFFSWLWLGKFDRLAELVRPSGNYRKRPDTRLELTSLERRENPQPIWISLAGGMVLGEVVLSRAHKTLQDVVLSGGWDSPGYHLPPLGTNVEFASTLPLALELPLRDSTTVMAGFTPALTQETSAVASQEGSGEQGQSRTNDLGDWANAVLFDLEKDALQRSQPSTPQSNDPPSGGGGGGTSSPATTGASGDGSGGGSAGRGAAGPVDLGSASLMTSPQPSSPSAVVPGVSSISSLTSLGPTSASNASTGSSSGMPAGSGSRPGTPQQGVGQTHGSATAAANLARLPLGFELNVGQAGQTGAAAGVRVVAHGSGFQSWATADALKFATPHSDAQTGQPSGRDVFAMQFQGVNPNAEVVGLDQLPTRSNYFVGNDPSQWHADVPQFAQVQYTNVYPGVDLVLQSHTPQDRIFEYNFVLHPGANLSAIRMNWQGLQGISLDNQDRLLLQTSGGTVIQDAPVLFQNVDGAQQTVAGQLVLLDQNTVGFQVNGTYNPNADLVLDPQINFSSYLGGSSDDKAYAIAVDAAGNSYLAGTTQSTDFPTLNGYNSTSGTAFVTKVNATGTALVYSTYLGSSLTAPAGIAVDLSGSVYVVGQTNGSSVPVTPGAYQSNTSVAGFVTKLNASGDALAYSTRFGSDGATTINAVAVDSSGHAFLTGQDSGGFFVSFPTTGGVVQTSLAGSNDAFAAELNDSGTALVYSTYLGGTSSDTGTGIAVDSTDNAYISGYTASTNFPTSAGAAYTSYQGGGDDAFVLKLNPTATTLVYSTYLGGSDTDHALAIALDHSGKAFVTGTTGSSNYPTVSVRCRRVWPAVSMRS